MIRKTEAPTGRHAGGCRQKPSFALPELPSSPENVSRGDKLGFVFHPAHSPFFYEDRTKKKETLELLARLSRGRGSPTV